MRRAPPRAAPRAFGTRTRTQDPFMLASMVFAGGADLQIWPIVHHRRIHIMHVRHQNGLQRHSACSLFIVKIVYYYCLLKNFNMLVLTSQWCPGLGHARARFAPAASRRVAVASSERETNGATEAPKKILVLGGSGFVGALHFLLLSLHFLLLSS